jgi:hypothetical protein
MKIGGKMNYLKSMPKFFKNSPNRHKIFFWAKTKNMYPTMILNDKPKCPVSRILMNPQRLNPFMLKRSENVLFLSSRGSSRLTLNERTCDF